MEHVSLCKVHVRIAPRNLGSNKHKMVRDVRGLPEKNNKSSGSSRPKGSRCSLQLAFTPRKPRGAGKNESRPQTPSPFAFCSEKSRRLSRSGAFSCMKDCTAPSEPSEKATSLVGSPRPKGPGLGVQNKLALGEVSQGMCQTRGPGSK